MSGVAPVLVLACGNPSRGDDAIGPVLAERLERWLERSGTTGIEVLVDFQLGPEHALDLEGRKRVLFVDAEVGAEAPFRFARVEPREATDPSTHAFSPGGVLAVARRVMSSSLPEAEILAVAGERFELGEPLSARARESVERAFDSLVAWCARSDAGDA
ncbi:MAG: hydrogenase maturation protease [Polyangiales bacterium]